MAFSSLTFLFGFLPIILLLNACLPIRLRTAWLALAGLLFYGWGSPLNLLLIPALSLSGWGAGLLSIALPERFRRPFLWGVAGVQAMVLLAFRLGAAGNLPFPVGICFYGLVSLSYLLGLAREEYPPQRDPILLTARIGLFPLVMGPVVSYRDLEENPAFLPDPRRFADGIMKFVCGLSKLFLLARPMGQLWRDASGSAAPAASAWLGLLGLAFAIYFEFSGYCDMAQGLGGMLGLTLPESFRYPIRARSLIEFSRTFNRTLTEWLRQYVYIPLSGGSDRWQRMLPCMTAACLAAGLWYGGGWNLLLWSLFLGGAAVLEKFCYGRFLEKLPGILRWLYTALLVLMGWVFFGTGTPAEAAGYFAALFGAQGFGSSGTLYLLLSSLPVLVVCSIVSAGLPARLSALLGRASPGFHGFIKASASLMGLLLCIIYAAAPEASFLLFGRF